MAIPPEPDRVEIHHHLVVGNGGWVRWTSGDRVGYIRFSTEPGERHVPTELYLPTDGLLTAASLRTLPLGRIEAWVNEPDTAQSLELRGRLPGVDLQRAAAHFATYFDFHNTRAATEAWPDGLIKETWVMEMFWAQEGHVDQQPMPKPSPWESAAGVEQPSLVLRLPDRKPYDDDFYKAVASTYSTAAARFRGPARALAAANDVPTTTVHRWVREARARGFLGKASWGKPG